MFILASFVELSGHMVLKPKESLWICGQIYDES